MLPDSDAAGHRKGDTLGPAKYFKRCTVGTDCGVFARGANGEHHFGLRNDGDGA
jgi:hypothetical protein